MLDDDMSDLSDDKLNSSQINQPRSEDKRTEVEGGRSVLMIYYTEFIKTT